MNDVVTWESGVTGGSVVSMSRSRATTIGGVNSAPGVLEQVNDEMTKAPVLRGGVHEGAHMVVVFDTLRLTIAFTKVRVGHSQTPKKMRREVIMMKRMMTRNMRRTRTRMMKLTIPCQTTEH